MNNIGYRGAGMVFFNSSYRGNEMDGKGENQKEDRVCGLRN